MQTTTAPENEHFPSVSCDYHMPKCQALEILCLTKHEVPAPMHLSVLGGRMTRNKEDASEPRMQITGSRAGEGSGLQITKLPV